MCALGENSAELKKKSDKKVKYKKLAAAGNTLSVIAGRAGDLDESEIISFLSKDSADSDNLFLYRKADPQEQEGEQLDYVIYGYNRDGSRVGLCANGARAFTWHLYQEQDQPESLRYNLLIDDTKVETSIVDTSVKRCSILVDEPLFETAQIPYTGQASSGVMNVHGEEFRYGVVNVGNPHCVLFLENAPSTELVSKIGPLLESDLERFPERVNVEFAYYDKSEQVIQMRIYERGVGETQSSGSGTIAAATAAMKYLDAPRELTVIMPGGKQKVIWNSNGSVLAVVEVDELESGWIELSL